MPAVIYPIQYRDMAHRGFRFLTVTEVKCIQTILWQNPKTNEYRVTAKFRDGRVIEFQPVADGTLKLVKPQAHSAVEA